MTTKFTPDHEWINIEDHDAADVGITLHAQVVRQGRAIGLVLGEHLIAKGAALGVEDHRKRAVGVLLADLRVLDGRDVFAREQVLEELARRDLQATQDLGQVDLLAEGELATFDVDGSHDWVRLLSAGGTSREP